MRSLMVRLGLYGSGLLALVGALGVSLLAQPSAAPAPEIDGASMMTAFGVLTAGALILRSRFKR